MPAPPLPDRPLLKGFRLAGQDDNAFAIIGRFERLARQQGWTKEDIAAVVEEAKRDDYDHLLMTFLKYAKT